MATGVNWLENPEFASVIRIAAGVASDILHDMFKLAGLTEEQADELLYDMGRVPLPDTSEQAIAALCCRLQDALADGAEHGGTLAERIRKAEKIEAEGKFTAAWGRETAQVIRALALLLLVAKSGADVGFSDGRFHADVQVMAGIPKEFVQTLDGAAAIIGAAVGERSASGEGPHPRGPSPSGQIQERDDRPAAGGDDLSPPADRGLLDIVSKVTAGASWQEALATIPSPGVPWLPLDEAKQLAETVFYALAAATSDDGSITSDEVIPPGFKSVYAKPWRQPGRGKGKRRIAFERTWSHPWHYTTPFVFAVGLVAVPPEKVSSNIEQFRLAVRVQSPQFLEEDTQSDIIETFRQWGKKIVSIRFTSPAHLLSQDSDGWGPWRGPRGPQFQIGAPISIIDGGVGAVTLIVTSEEGAILGLTAGHVVRHGGAGKVGTHVFCPPQATAGGSYGQGVIDRLTYLPRRRLIADGFRIRTPDFALIKLNAAATPSSGTERTIARGVVHSGRFPMAPLRTGDKVFKVAARTPQAEGIITAVDFYLEAQDPISGQIVFVNNVVEIELDRNDYILSGDSGALLYRVATKGGFNEPVAMLVCGTRDGKLGGENSKRCQVMYCLPFTELAWPVQPS